MDGYDHGIGIGLRLKAFALASAAMLLVTGTLGGMGHAIKAILNL